MVKFSGVDSDKSYTVRVSLLLNGKSIATAQKSLKALAKVSRTLRDQTICTQLRGCEDADGIYALLAGTSTSNAA